MSGGPHRSRLRSWSQGCCSYGAHFTGAKDARRVQAAAATLTPEQWQFYKRARPEGSRKPNVSCASRSGDLTTRLVNEACIFLNRPDFPGGAGCALHRAALERGVPHLELKPDVCWQLPLSRDDEVGRGRTCDLRHPAMGPPRLGQGGVRVPLVVHRVTRRLRGHAARIEELEQELVAMVGKKIYKRLVAYLAARAQVTTGDGPRPTAALQPGIPSVHLRDPTPHP